MNTIRFATRSPDHSAFREAPVSPRFPHRRLALCVALAVGALLTAGTGMAATAVGADTSPTGGQVVGGVGAITRQGANTVIRQQSRLLALNWQTFNVGKDATVTFNQPSFNAVALNRILDQNPSQIFGKVSSNGQVFLINTHGIIFGAGAQLNVGGLMASTLDLTPTDFLANRYNLDAHGGSAGIVNHGTIAAASGGSVSLIGGKVENDGLILANYGHINLDGADRATLDFDGNGLVSVQIAGALEKRLDADQAAVVNKGTLRAESGTVVLQASAAKDLFTNLVNNSGVVDAHGISTAGGVVRLVGTGGNTITSGSIDVSGVHGGSVQVLSDQNVDVDGSVDASGTRGGGSIRVGGGARGGEGLTQAENTTVGANAVLNVDATQSGNGGSIAVWSNQTSSIAGSFSARGGAQGGNGGAVETSGEHVHIADGTLVSTLAPAGQSGNWLIDPTDFTISSSGSGTISGTPGVPTSDVSATTLQIALANGDVSIESSNGASGTSGDINIDQALSWSANTLTLTAAHSININADVSVRGTGGLGLHPTSSVGDSGALVGGTVIIGSGDTLTLGGSGTLYLPSNGIENNGSLVFDLGTDYTYAYEVSGTGTLTQQGASALTLTGTNTYTGGTTVSAGTLALSGSGDISASSGVSDAGTLDISGTTSGATIKTLSGAGAVTLGGKTLKLSAAADTFSGVIGGTSDAGSLEVSGGTEKLTGANVYTGATIIDSGATLQIGDAGTTGSIAGDVTDNGTLAFKRSDALTYGGVISGGGVLQQLGAGTLTLTNTNTYSGGTTILAGTLQLGDGTNDGSIIGDVANSGALVFDNTAATTFGGAISQTGTLTQKGTGTLTLTGTNIYTGGTAINSGSTLALTGTGSLADSGSVIANGTFDISNTASGASIVSLGGSGSVTLGGKKLTLNNGLSSPVANNTFSGVIGGTGGQLALTGGMEVLTGANTYDGGTSISSGATLQVGNNGTTGSIAGNVTDGGTLAFYRTDALTYGGVISGGGALQQLGAGTLTLTNANTYTGDTAILHGTLQLGDGTTDGSITGDVANSSALVFDNTAATTFGGVISQNGTVTQKGSGALTLTAANTYSGGTTVDAGTLSVNGSANLGASASTITLDGGTLQTNAPMAIDQAIVLGSGGGMILVANAGYQVVVNGGITGAGDLVVNGPGPFVIDSDITTGGNQTYNGPVKLNGGTTSLTLSSSGNGATILFASTSTLDGNGSRALMVSTTGTGGSVVFDGTVGGTTPLGGLTTNSTTFSAGALAIGSGGLSVTTSGTATLNDNITTSGGTVGFDGAVVLDAPTISIDTTDGGTVAAGAGVTFTGTVDNASTTAESLAVNAGGGAVTFGGAVGGNATNGALGALAVNSTGVTSFNAAVKAASLTTDAGGGTVLGGDVTTSGTQTYGDAVTLGGNTTLTGTTVSLGGVIGAGNNLTVAGNAVLGGAVGGLNTLLVNGTTAFNAADVSTAGDQTYTGAVTLGVDTTLASSGNGTIGFGSTVDGAHALTVNTGGATSFGGAIGGTTALTSLTTDVGGSTMLGGNVTTSGAQSYNDAVTLGSDATLATTNSNVGFAGTVDNASATARGLTVNAGSGEVSFDDAVGSGANGALSGLTTSSGTLTAGTLNIGSGGLSVTTTAGGIAQGGAFKVAGASSFNAVGNAITLTNTNNNFIGAVSLTNTGSGAVSLDNGGNALTLGTLSLEGGALTLTHYGPSALALNGGITTSGGAVTFGGAIALGSPNVTIDTTGSGSSAGADIDLGGAVDGSGHLTLTAGSGNVSLQSVGATTALTGLTVTGNITTLNGDVTTSGDQTYNGAVQLGSNVTLTTTNSAVNLAGTVDNAGATAQSLTVDAGSGVVTFGGAVGAGANNALGALAVNGSGATSFGAVKAASLATGTGTSTLGGNIATSGTQAYNGAVQLGTGVILTTTNSAVSFADAVDSASATAEDLAVNAGSGVVTFGAAVGGTHALGALTVGGSGATSFQAVKAASLATGTGTSTLAGDIATSGTQAYNGAVQLGTSVKLTTTNSAVKFVGTVDNASATAEDLTINAGSGAVTLDGAVGGDVATGSLNAMSVAAGTFGAGALNIGAGGLSITTTAGDIVDVGTPDNAWSVTGSATFNAGAHAITLDKGANDFSGPVNLANNGNGSVSVDNGIHALTLGNVHVGTGTLSLSGAGLSQASGTSVTQASGAGAVTLDAGTNDIVLDGAGNNFTGAVNLASTGAVSLGNGGNALTLGALTLGNGALTLDHYSSLALNNNITTQGGAVSFGNDVTVTGANVVIDTTGGNAVPTGANISFGGDVSGSAGTENLTLNPGASSVSLATVGAHQALGALTINGSSVLNGNVNTAGAQKYVGAVALAADATLKSTGGGVEFDSTVTGGHALEVDASGLAKFGNAVGASGAPLTSLKITSGSLDAAALYIGTGGLSITTSSGGIAQGDAWIVQGSSSFNAGANAITLNNTGNDFIGAVGLTNSGNNAVYLDNGGHALTLGTLTLGSGALNLTHYGPTALVLNNGITTAGGNVAFGGAVTLGSHDVTIDTTGRGLVGVGANISFGGDVSGTSPAGSSLSLEAGTGGAVSLVSVGSANTLEDLTVAAGSLVVPSTLAVAGDLSIHTVAALTTGTAWSGGSVSLAGDGGLTLGGNVTTTAGNGALQLSSSGGAIQQTGGIITTDVLTGSSSGGVALGNANLVGTLGDFTANGFNLSNAQALTVTGIVHGGPSNTLTTTSGDLTVAGNVTGAAVGLNANGNLAINGGVNSSGTTTLTAGGTIGEGASGVLTVGTLAGTATGAATLGGANAIANLGNFTANGFSLGNAQALTVGGAVNGGSSTELTTTAGDLTIAGNVTGASVGLNANGNLAINGGVNSSDTTTLTAGGAIDEGSSGVLAVGTLTGRSAGVTALVGANAIASLGDFNAHGLRLNNAQALTVASGATVDGGDATTLTTTGAGGDVSINGTLVGTTVTLASSGAIAEGVNGSVHAGTLTGDAVHGAQLTGTNAIGALGNFTAQGLALTNGQALTIDSGATVDGAASTTLTTTGANGDITINGALRGATTTLLASGAVREGAGGTLTAGTLLGSSVGATALTGGNAVANLGNYTASGFALATNTALTVVAGATVDGGANTALTTAGAGNALTINGNVRGGTTALVSADAINQGAAGAITATTLTGNSAGDTTLNGTNQIASLDVFNARNFTLTDAHALAVGGPLTTTGGNGNINLTTTGAGNTLTVNQAVHGAAVTLASAGDLTVANAVAGNKIGLAANGQLAINAAVDGGSGAVTLTQTGNGGISGNANGAITAGTLTGSAVGATVLGSAVQPMANHVGVLGGFVSPAGFSFTNAQTLTLASVNGSAYTVNAGQSPVHIAVTNGDLLQSGNNWLYDSTGTWAASGHIGTAAAPIYVMGVGNQFVGAIGAPPAYFYAVDKNGSLLPVSGGSSVNVPTSILSSNSQGVNGHGDRYIDVGVITAVYRPYGVVNPGILLPPDQLDCESGQVTCGGNN